jgi:hypothetical protein
MSDTVVSKDFNEASDSSTEVVPGAILNTLECIPSIFNMAKTGTNIVVLISTSEEPEVYSSVTTSNNSDLVLNDMSPKFSPYHSS